jgi:hypothetical protein
MNDNTKQSLPSRKEVGTSQSTELSSEGTRKRKGGDFIERTGGIATSSTSTLPYVPLSESLDFDLPSRRSVKREFFTRQSPRRTWSGDRAHSNVFFLCPDITCQPLHCLVGDDEVDATMLPSSPPTFGLKKSDIFQGGREISDPSPTSIVNRADRDPNNVFFWRRSMAWDDSWSSDDDEESEGRFIPRTILREQLKVPELQQGVKAKQSSNEPTSQIGRPPRPQIRRPRRWSHRDSRVPTMNNFCTPQTQRSTSEMYWEEKIADDIDWENIAKLSIS